MRSVAARNVLGGRWAASPVMWLVLFGPASVLVIMQEVTTPFRTWWALPLSAVAQHAAAGLVILILIGVLRRWFSVVPVALAVLVWVASGAVRGVISGALADAYSAAEPQYGYRVLSWVAVAAIWMPLTVYTATQIDRRSRLMSSLITLRSDIEVEYAEAETSELEREQRLALAVRAAIAPVVIEIRQSLEAALAESKQPLQAISAKIESVVGNVLDIIVHEPIGSAPRMAPPRRLLAPLSAALTFDRSRPFFASVLVALATAVLLTPEALRLGGGQEAVHVLVAIAVGAAVMAGLLALLNREQHARAARTWHLALVLTIASVAAVVVFLLTGDYPLHLLDAIRVVSIPVCLVLSSATLSASVGLSLANLDVIPEERRLIDELTSLRQLAAEREEATRKQFTDLMHGPVLGRLSACVMALNFHLAGGPSTVEARTRVAAQVIAHLELVTADLEQMVAPSKNDSASP